MGLFKRWAINLIFALTALVYALGLFIDVMDIDSAQYAELSREMLESGSFLEVYLLGHDYLDKPPFLFWITSLSFWIFGEAEWSFRLGSILFSAVGIIATYKLGNLLYNKRIGFVAALMLMSSLAFVLMNNDVRTDTILTSAIVISVWKLMAYLYYKRKRDLLFGFTAMAIAMMTKGPIGMIVPLMALGSYTIGRKKYADLFRPQWLLGFLWVALLLIPMSYGLYQQFDLHPEKVLAFNSDTGVVKKENVSGLRFFFWDQSFGRITGGNQWSNSAGPFFFVHTFIWSFFPWALLAVWAFFWRIIVAVNDVIKGEKKQEWLSLGGFILPILALSFSQYKLPHYINIALPFAAIFTSEFVLRVAYEKSKRWYSVAWTIQGLIIAFSILAYILISFFFFPTVTWSLHLLVLINFGIGLYYFFKGAKLDRLVVSSLFSVLGVFALVNGHFYPELMKYQPSEEVSKDLEYLEVNPERFYIKQTTNMYSMCFYTQSQPIRLNAEIIANTSFLPESYIYTDAEGLEFLSDNQVFYEVVKSYDEYPVTRLSLPFLMAKTRKENVRQAYLVRVLTR